MSFYVRFSGGALASYTGMSQATVEALLEGKDYEFIDRATYETELAEKQP